MRHLIMRGRYKPLGVSGESMMEAMLALKPEIYGSIADPEKVELNGLLYIFERLPKGIEECRYIKLITREGYDKSKFERIVPSKRVRDCYRIDNEQMVIEMTRGGSDIYDILTHLTFMYIEAEKIRRNGMDASNRKNRVWIMFEKFIEDRSNGIDVNIELGLTYLNTLLGRTFSDVSLAYDKFLHSKEINSLFEITYWLGRLSMDEYFDQIDREISFSSNLRDSLGHHAYGEQWANKIKKTLWEKQLFQRPMHIISANLHSVQNVFFADHALCKQIKANSIFEYAIELSKSNNSKFTKNVREFAEKNGMISLEDTSGTNIGVQVFDLYTISRLGDNKFLQIPKYKKEEAPVLIVMDYAFGEQAFETMDELLKPFEYEDAKHYMPVISVNIMGKAGILEGDKGDIMIPNAHISEGYADNYPFDNKLTLDNFKDAGIKVYTGSMITVLGTSLQNKDILSYFLKSSWKACGLEMEGAHYQKAIQAASKIRKSIREDVALRYAYYASDNPLETGSTLASGSLGQDGVKPTYLITLEILKGCFND